MTSVADNTVPVTRLTKIVPLDGDLHVVDVRSVEDETIDWLFHHLAGLEEIPRRGDCHPSQQSAVPTVLG